MCVCVSVHRHQILLFILLLSFHFILKCVCLCFKVCTRPNAVWIYCSLAHYWKIGNVNEGDSFPFPPFLSFSFISTFKTFVVLFVLLNDSSGGGKVGDVLMYDVPPPPHIFTFGRRHFLMMTIAGKEREREFGLLGMCVVWHWWAAAL